MNTTCDQIAEALSAYADGQQTARETMLVRAHLQTCAACTALLSDWQQMVATTQDPVGDLPQRVAARVQMQGPRAGGRWSMRSSSGSKYLVAAALAVATIGSSVLAGTARRDSERSVDRASKPAASTAASVAPKSSSKPAGVPEVSASQTVGATPKPTVSTEPTRTRETPGFSTTRVADQELMLIFTLDRSGAGSGQTVTAGFSLRNISDGSVTFAGDSESAFDLIVTDAQGREVFRRSAAWSQDQVARTLAAGQEIAERFEFTAPAVDGTYAVRAVCRCERSRGVRPSLETQTPRGGSLTTDPLRLAIDASRG